MAMISGPFTDEVVKMLMREERRLCDGDGLKNKDGVFGVLFQNRVWIADPVVRTVSEGEFGVSHSELLQFPEPFEDTFRFTEGDGNIFLPEYKEADKTFLRECGYQPASPQKTLERLLKAKGEKRHRLYPLSCKIGVWEEYSAAEVARILTVSPYD